MKKAALEKNSRVHLYEEIEDKSSCDRLYTQLGQLQSHQAPRDKVQIDPLTVNSFFLNNKKVRNNELQDSTFRQ